MSWHSYRPVKVFYTNIVNKDDVHLGYSESWTGYECWKCSKRYIKQSHASQSVGATQNAYDWLNDKQEPAKILQLVKK